MLVLTLQTEMPLLEPNEEFGFVTWLDVTIREFDAPAPTLVATARIAMIHAADAMNRGVAIRAVLDAVSEEFLELYDVFFDEQHLKENFENGVGMDVMYFDQIEVSPPWLGRKIEEAVVRRLADTWGEGCAIAVMPVADASEIARWREIGFAVAREPVRDNLGYAYLDISLKHPDVTATDEQGHCFTITVAGAR